jgi:pimeloyl-ACP methyl ester carboxylesterase
MTEIARLPGGRTASYPTTGNGRPALMFAVGSGFTAYLSGDAELLSDVLPSYLIDPHGPGSSTLIVAGEVDFICGPVQARPLADAITGSRLVIIPGCGHIPSIEAPRNTTRRSGISSAERGRTSRHAKEEQCPPAPHALPGPGAWRTAPAP